MTKPPAGADTVPIDLSILTLSYPGTVRKYLPRLVENLDAQIGDSAKIDRLPSQ